MSSLKFDQQLLLEEIHWKLLNLHVIFEVFSNFVFTFDFFF